MGKRKIELYSLELTTDEIEILLNTLESDIEFLKLEDENNYSANIKNIKVLIFTIKEQLEKMGVIWER